MSSRNGTLDLLKFIFIMFIFIHHSWQFDPICIEGYIGVEFFYMVTGILMANKVANLNYTDSDIYLMTRKILQHKLAAFYLEFLIATFTGFVLLHIFVPNAVPHFINGLSLVVGTLWYLSAMMGALMILVPLMLKYKSFFTNIGAPLIVLIGYGTIAFKYGHMGPILEPVFDGFIHIGLIRAIVDISLGYLLYFIAMKIRTINFTTFGFFLLTLLEITSYFIVIYLIITIKERGNADFIIVLLLAIGIAITFSQRSLIFPYFQKRFYNKLGLFSLNVFLNHFYIGFIIAQMGGASWPISKSFSYYFIGMVCCSVLNYFIAHSLRKINYKEQLLSLIIVHVK